MSAVGSRTLLGTLLGGISGYALSQIDVLRKKSVGTSAVYVGGFTVAAAAIGGFIGYKFDRAAALSPTNGPQPTLPPTTPQQTPPPQPAPNANYMPPGGNLITLVPGNTTQSEGIRVGDSVTIQLPAGASWQPGPQNPSSGNQTMSWIYAGPGTIYLRWSAPDGSSQQTAMTFYTVSF